MIEAMKQWLDALEHAAECVRNNYCPEEMGHDWDKQIHSLRQAIAEAEKQEPVAYLCEPDEDGLYGLPTTDKACEKCFPVYRRPLANQTKREWVGLEDEDVATVKNEFNRGALWAEQVLKEKNT